MVVGSGTVILLTEVGIRVLRGGLGMSGYGEGRCELLGLGL